MSEIIYDYPTILLSDGTREFVGGDEENTDAQFQRTIRERLGDDAEEVYKALKDYWLDFYAYNTKGEEDNAEAESWRNYAIDVWHDLQEIAYAKRLDRKKLIALAERMERDL